MYRSLCINPLFAIAECICITNKKRYFQNVVWTWVLLLGAAQTLVAGYSLSYCHLSLGGGTPLCWWPWRMFPVGGEKTSVWKWLQVKLMVRRGGISRILCCYKYMKVVLKCVCSFSVYHCVSLLSFCAFLEGCTAVSLCTCVVSLACYYLVVWHLLCIL